MDRGRWMSGGCVAAVLVLGIAGAVFAQGREAELSWERFEELHRALAPPVEAWRALPWHTSVLEAQGEAAREKRPVYMLVRSGQPLGCV